MFFFLREHFILIFFFILTATLWGMHETFRKLVIKEIQKEKGLVLYHILKLLLSFSPKHFDKSKWKRFIDQILLSHPTKIQKKHRGGVYFCVYGIAFWTPIPQKLTPPVLLFFSRLGIGIGEINSAIKVLATIPSSMDVDSEVKQTKYRMYYVGFFTS